MLNAFKKQLFTNWHPMRWVALGVGLVLFYNWLIYSAPVSGFLALFFLYQAVTNTGCMAGQCEAPAYSETKEPTETIEFEEITEES